MWLGRGALGQEAQHAGGGVGGVRQDVPVMGGGSGSLKGSSGPKKVGISEVVTGVLRHSSLGRSNDARHSDVLSKVSKLTRLNETVDSAMVAVDSGSIPSIIIVEKFSSSSLEVCESSGCGCGAPEPDMVEGGKRKRQRRAPSDHESSSGAKVTSELHLRAQHCHDTH